MINRIVFGIVVSLLFTISVFGQNPEIMKNAKERSERIGKVRIALDSIADFSPQLKTLREKGERAKMVVEATKTGDLALLPHLRVLADDKGEVGIISHIKTLPRSRRESEAFEAHIALAKLGDPNVMPEISAELASDDTVAQDTAILKLVRIGSKEAYQKLFELLDDTTPRPSVPDELIRTKSHQTMQELNVVFDDAPKKPNGVVLYDVAVWKEWFKSKKLID